MLDDSLKELLAKIAELPAFESHAPLTPMSKTCVGETPLHVAASWGDLKAIKLLAEAGVNLDARGDLGWTPLHEAIGPGHAEAISLLIKLGAKTTVADDQGLTAPDLAQLIGNEAVKRVFDNDQKKGIGMLSV